MAILAPSLRNLFNEIDARWPNRDRRTDGWIGDAAHQQRKSDHNPDSRGIVHAIDIDKDGIEPYLVVEQCIDESRPTSYVVYNREIWSRTKDFKPRPYTGDNPHTDHIHVSIQYGDHWESADWVWNISSFEKGSGSASRGGASDDMNEFGGAFAGVADVFNTTGLALWGATQDMEWLMQ